MTAICEGAELTAASGKKYLAVGALGQDNVWTACEKDTANIVVLKAPSPDDTDSSWPRFQHEMVMHELLKDCKSIRKQVDRISPETGDGSPPILVLEIFDTTLWHARTKRPFSKAEIKVVARSILQGLQEVHNHGLVYVDLKMQNVMLSGFDPAHAGDGSKLVTKLGDLGIVMYPAKGTAQPVAYRAPEVFFKGELAPPADIWAFGLIYCHLLEAQTRFSKTGLYDELNAGSKSMFEREQAMRSALSNDYDLENVDCYKDCALPYRNHNHETGNHWAELLKRGLDEKEVEFLQWVLQSDPQDRPTAQAILDSRWLQTAGSKVATSTVTSDVTAGVSKPHHHHSATVGTNGSDPRQSIERIAAPTSITLPPPNPLKRLASDGVFTPTGSGAFDSMLRKRAENGSPIKEHPLMVEAISPSKESKDVTMTDAKTASKPTTQMPAQSESSYQTSATTNFWKSNAPADTTEHSPAQINGAASVDAHTATAQRPSYVGRDSSTGGTYLSYR